MMRKRPGCVLGMFSSLEVQVINKKMGEVREVVAAGVTSLALERADAARLLMMVREATGTSKTSPIGSVM